MLSCKTRNLKEPVEQPNTELNAGLVIAEKHQHNFWNFTYKGNSGLEVEKYVKVRYLKYLKVGKWLKVRPSSTK